MLKVRNILFIYLTAHKHILPRIIATNTQLTKFFVGQINQDYIIVQPTYKK